MGKRLQTKYSDLNQRIIKRSKYIKENIRKRKSNIDVEEPLKKALKLETSGQEISRETVFVEKLDDNGTLILNTREHVSYDLFFSDELKNNYINFNSKDMYFHINDEVALEGLDGITIEAFWKRFLTALDGPLCLDKQLERFIWENIILSQDQFQFFELPVPRPELVIYNVFDYLHTEIGVVMEVAYAPPDIYPIALVNASPILGSCSTFKERINITSIVQSLSLDEAEERYGQKLVIVASQNMRIQALYEDTADPCIELLNMDYSILERIGRSRKLGELTQGTMSITAAFKIDAKSIFHYKKNLCLNNLISTQMFIIKSALLDHNKTGSLIQLKRFYTNIRSRQSCIADQIINVIKNQPNCRIYSKLLKSLFSDNIQCVNKLLKNPEFKKFVTTKILPYRTFYPDATRSEYETKKTKVEKELVYYELIDPYVNPMAYWRAQEKTDPDEEEDKEEKLSGHKMYGADTIRDIYQYIRSNEDKGCFGNEIKLNVGIDKNTARLALNKLLGKALIDFTKFDDGKQRKYVYKAVCWKRPDYPTPSSPPIQKVSSIKMKMLEKQKAAVANKKENQAINIETEPSTNLQLDSCSIKTPDISNCKFIVAQIEQEDKVEQNKNPAISEIKLKSSYTIHLSYVLLNTEQIFNINQLLLEITPTLNILEVKAISDNFLKRKYELDVKIKVSLFKACLGDVKAIKEFTEVKRENNPNEKMSIPNLSQEQRSITDTNETSKLDYMGSNPTEVFNEVDQDVTTKIIVSTTPAEIRLEKQYPKSKLLTERVSKRMQIIIDLVNEMRLIEEIFTVQKCIIDKEIETGHSEKIDRKSLLRILKRLVEEGFIKIFKIIVNNEKIYKTIVFVCHPTVTSDDDVIKSASEQLKWKYFFGVVRKTSKPHIPGIQKNIENKFSSSPFTQGDVLNSIKEMKQLETDLLKEIKRKLNKNIGKVYGVKPKFTRMRIMHEFLFFLIRENKNKDTILPMESVIRLFKSCRIELSENDIQEMPKMYHNEISWKMFVPPLPSHLGWEEGWALVCDIILRLPVSIFLKLHNCTYEDADLLEILNHPIKRYYLVKDLPEKSRKTILFKRKYLFSLYDTISYLVFCGLVQFGPQKYREKDQVFIYLNTKASLLDTRTSSPGYNEIEQKEYPRLSFTFKTLADIDHYWQKLNKISLNTYLNSREPGKLVTLVYINSKPEIVECVKSRTVESAKLHDNGNIPGDGKGACGLDSSLWCHLVRNWMNTDVPAGNSLYTELKRNVFKENAPQLVSFKELRLNSTKVYLAHKKAKKKVNKVSKIPKKSKRKHVIKRTIPKRKSTMKKEYYDAVDRKILKKIAGRRIRWSKKEEDMIYLAKVADLFLGADKTYRKQIVPLNVIRDVLHIVSAESKLKTSRAIQRRWMKLQQSGVYHNIEEQFPNLFKVIPIKDTFGLLANKLNTREDNKKTFRITDGQHYAAFVILYHYLLKNMHRIMDILHGNIVNINHLSEQNLEYTEKNLIDIEKKVKKYKDAKDQEDIKKDVLKSVVHSSLCCKEGEVDLSIHLLKIYQNHPDLVVRAAVTELRETSTITRQKITNKKTKLWDTPFALSQYYIFSQYSTFDKTTAVEAYTTMLDIVHNEGNGIQNREEGIQHKRYGQLLGINEFFGYCDSIGFEFNLPQYTIALNPKIENHDELVHELALRFQIKLKSSQQDSNEAEIDLEEEDDINDTVKISADQEIEKNVSEPSDLITPMDVDIEDTQINPLDLTIDHGIADTIDRLKTWVTDRVKINDERRSPSPEFMLIPSDIDESYGDDQNPSEDHIQEKVVAKKIKPREKQSKQIPSLEEIKAGMLELNTNNEERTIPYITELSDLLKENFSELKTNVNVLALKEHFITQYATLNRILYEDYEYIKNHYMIKFIEDRTQNKKLWDRIESDIFIKDFLLMPNFEDLMREDNATDEDILLANEIIQFAASKTLLGASAQELKDNFLHREKNISLLNILKHLMKAGILLQTGICSLTFVHYSYQYAWILQDVICTNVDTKEQNKGQKRCSMKVMPWVRVDGVLNKITLKIWISNVLSYCLDYPKVPFSKLCDKYCFIKPVDLFFIVQILEELGCIELLFYDKMEEDLFTEWTMTKERYATFLDDLEEIIIQPNIASMTRLGSFFYETI
ncbi:general transcription factor 3C polypeptide 1 [Diorhabda sublineata]|uniref:general transcription factor 3C polypeptide 1 n=1 Tax=Diorhabda sublineata TaxID=1163346 RepID=UPI0024E0783B|nr:general transcription factor 3C polypeptide 1 [Diorhabda sublineata]